MVETTTTLQAAAYGADGTPRERVTLPAALFDGTVNVPVMHQAVKGAVPGPKNGLVEVREEKRHGRS